MSRIEGNKETDGEEEENEMLMEESEHGDFNFFSTRNGDCVDRVTRNKPVMADKVSEYGTTFPARNSLQSPTRVKFSFKTFLGISMSILITTVIFRPTLVWNLQYLWKAFSDFLQDIWNIIYDSVGHDEYLMVVW
ncbi:hypothetical protein AVEN_262405-1, partial [Araneus ventricosus]